MDYKVVVSPEAEEDLDQCLHYLILEKKNKQAAKNVLEDFEAVVDLLKIAAEGLPFCDNVKLRTLGYRRMNFLRHNYFILYRVMETTVYIDAVFHGLQDYERRMM